MTAPAKGNAVLFSEMTPPEGGEDAFNDWYDGHHTPNHVDNVPGFLSAQRYKSPTGPHYLAVYELDSPAALETEAYRGRKYTPDAPTKAMLDSVTGFSRYIGSEVCVASRPGAAGEPLDAEMIIAVFLAAPSEKWPELLTWCRSEHAPTLLECEDWLMVRCMEIVDSNPEPYSHMILNYVRDLSAMQSDELDRSWNTEGGRRLGEEAWFDPQFVFYQRRGARFLPTGTTS